MNVGRWQRGMSRLIYLLVPVIAGSLAACSATPRYSDIDKVSAAEHVVSIGSIEEGPFVDSLDFTQVSAGRAAAKGALHGVEGCVQIGGSGSDSSGLTALAAVACTVIAVPVGGIVGAARRVSPAEREAITESFSRARAELNYPAAAWRQLRTELEGNLQLQINSTSPDLTLEIVQTRLGLVGAGNNPPLKVFVSLQVDVRSNVDGSVLLSGLFNCESKSHRRSQWQARGATLWRRETEPLLRGAAHYIVSELFKDLPPLARGADRGIAICQGQTGPPIVPLN